MWVLTIGCDGVGEPERRLEADPSRDGRDGRDGPFGVATLEVRTPARVTGTVPVTVTYPADDALEPAVDDAPAAVVVPGALLAPERYDWLMVHLASRGYAVASPAAPLDFAITEPGDPEVALGALVDLSAPGAPLDGLYRRGPVTALGHSLGGVVAARTWLREPNIDGLVLLASFPAGGDPVEQDEDRVVLLIAGAEDGISTEALEQARDRFGGEAWLAFVAGMNHYGWVTDPTDSELARDAPAVGDPDQHRIEALRVIDPYLDGLAATGAPDGLGAPSPGVTWSR
ncbi:MAG: alpha/beta hydrolase [Myxococcota bacterium]